MPACRYPGSARSPVFTGLPSPRSLGPTSQTSWLVSFSRLCPGRPCGHSGSARSPAFADRPVSSVVLGAARRMRAGSGRRRVFSVRIRLSSAGASLLRFFGHQEATRMMGACSISDLPAPRDSRVDARVCKADGAIRRLVSSGARPPALLREEPNGCTPAVRPLQQAGAELASRGDLQPRRSTRSPQWCPRSRRLPAVRGDLLRRCSLGAAVEHKTHSNFRLQLTDQACCVRGCAAHLRRLPAAEANVRQAQTV